MVTRVLTFEHPDGVLEHLTSQVPDDSDGPRLLSWANRLWERGFDARYRLASVWVPDREEFDSTVFDQCDLDDLDARLDPFRNRLAATEASLGDLLVLLGEMPIEKLNAASLEGVIARAKEALSHG